jgi:hypothetical protein
MIKPERKGKKRYKKKERKLNRVIKAEKKLKLTHISVWDAIIKTKENVMCKILVLTRTVFFS